MTSKDKADREFSDVSYKERGFFSNHYHPTDCASPEEKPAKDPHREIQMLNTVETVKINETSGTDTPRSTIKSLDPLYSSSLYSSNIVNLKESTEPLRIQKLTSFEKKMNRKINEKKTNMFRDLSSTRQDSLRGHNNPDTSRTSSSFIKNIDSRFDPLTKKDEFMEDLKEDCSKSEFGGISLPNSRRALISFERSPMRINQPLPKVIEKSMRITNEQGEEAKNLSFHSYQSEVCNEFGVMRKSSRNRIAEENLNVSSRNKSEGIEYGGGNSSIRISNNHLSDIRNHRTSNNLESVNNNQIENIRNDSNQIRQGSQRIAIPQSQDRLASSHQFDAQKLANMDANLYFRIFWAFMITIIISSSFLISILDNDLTYQSVFIVIYCFLAYIVVENMLRLRYPEMDEWRKRERIFNMLEAAALILFQIFVDLYLQQKTGRILLVFIPMTLMTISYCFVSTAPRSTKDIQILNRIFITCECLLLLLKLSGYSEWSWAGTLLFLWVYFAFASVYTIILVILLVIAVFVALFKIQSLSAPNLSIRIIGLIWYSVFNSLSILGLSILIGIEKSYDSGGNTNLLRISLNTAIYTSCSLLAYTLLLFFPLKKFFMTFDRSRNMIAQTHPSIQNIQSRHLLDFQTEKIANYFVMISSTYFLPLKQGLLTKSQEKMKKIKNSLTSSKLVAASKMGDHDCTITTVSDKIKVIQELRKDKKSLDYKLKASSDILNYFTKKHSRNRKLITLEKLGEDFINKNDNSIKSEESPRHVPDNDKLVLSADDIKETMKEGYNNQKDAREDPGLCYICFESKADAVLMNCGHAGVCCECATSMIRQKNECMECRKPVEAIYKIEIDSANPNIVKGVELTKVIEVGLVPELYA